MILSQEIRLCILIICMITLAAMSLVLDRYCTIREQELINELKQKQADHKEKTQG